MSGDFALLRRGTDGADLCEDRGLFCWHDLHTESHQIPKVPLRDQRPNAMWYMAVRHIPEGDLLLWYLQGVAFKVLSALILIVSRKDSITIFGHCAPALFSLHVQAKLWREHAFNDVIIQILMLCCCSPLFGGLFGGSTNHPEVQVIKQIKTGHHRSENGWSGTWLLPCLNLMCTVIFAKESSEIMQMQLIKCCWRYVTGYLEIPRHIWLMKIPCFSHVKCFRVCNA